MACHISVNVYCTYNRYWPSSGSSVGDMYSTPSLPETFWLDLEGGGEGDSERRWEESGEEQSGGAEFHTATSTQLLLYIIIIIINRFV